MRLYVGSFLLTAILCVTGTSGQQLKTLNVGLLFVSNSSRMQLTVGYETSASAVLIARDRVEREGLLPGYKLNFTYRFDNCVESLAAGYAIEYMRDLEMDVVVGPTCSNPAMMTGILGRYYNVPVMTWGLTTDSELGGLGRMPTIALLSGSSFSLGMAVRRLLSEYKWNEFAFIYSNYGDAEKCENMKIDIQRAVDVDSSITLSYMTEIRDVTEQGMISVISAARQRARIFVVCLVEGIDLKRRFMLAAEDSGYNTDEYVYIFADTKSKGFVVPLPGGEERMVWEAVVDFDGRDNEAKEAFKNVLCVSDMMGSGALAENYSRFGSEVIARMSEPPFLCTTACQGKEYSTASMYAGQLHDAVLVYAHAKNKTLAQDPNRGRDGVALIKNIEMDIEGITGPVRMSSNGSRLPTYYLVALNGSLIPQRFADIFVDGYYTTFTPHYKSETELWVDRKERKRPLAIPICGFTGSRCPVDFVQAYLVWVILASLVVLAAIAAAIAGIIFSIHAKKKELERMNKMWQISFSELKSIQKRQKEAHSVRSLSSGPSSVGTKMTNDSKTETRHFKFFFLDNEKVAALKHSTKIRLDHADGSEMRQLRNLEHDNLNRFIGLCQDAPEMKSIWKYCGRGSLKDVIQRSTITMDYFFVYSLIRDIVNGLMFIHKSFLNYHGYLTSGSCLVDDRFQVKISYFGLKRLRELDVMSNEDLLWTAPEILKGLTTGSQKADIYSFAIICSELVTMRPAWDLENRTEPAETLLYWLKRNRSTPPRPDLVVHETLDVNPGFLELVRDCWAEEPERRPAIEQIRTLMRGMLSGRNDNLMDHVFNIMESYAATLEDEVSARTKELVEEKKKSDVLLYRMLPRQVADKLKLGQSVQPETFDSVTVFFSDVVSFTTLASRCTPLQVVNLLNDLYSVFDGIIEAHDVYKVETIGDGYLCVSGLPHRNGNEHVREIASMSLAFLQSLTSFRIPHLPSERMNLRIGMHCGSVVAGVVGLTMPRYCLFGDTVNTASRMESNGKAAHIHLSAEANHLLVNVVGGFTTESRGEVIIKGKGVMETFWLVGRADGPPPAPLHSIIKEVQKQASKDRTTVSPAYSSPRSVTPTGIYSDYKRQGETVRVESIDVL